MVDTHHEEADRSKGEIPFFPHHLLREVMVVFGVLVVLAVLVTFFPAPVEEKADPMTTPAHIKPEWYFLASYQVLRLIPNKVLGILIQTVALVALLLLPYLDRGPSTRPRDRWPVILLGVLGLGAGIALTLWGLVS